MIRILILSLVIVAVLALAVGGLVAKGVRRFRPAPGPQPRPRLAI
jgi:hypothetical protein